MNTLTRFICACLFVIIAGLLADRHFTSNQQAVLATARQAPVQTEPKYALDENALRNAVQPIVHANARLSLSVSIADLQSDKMYHYGENVTYTAASIAKLLTASLYLHQVETGKATLDQKIAGSTARTQLEKLIVDSDNTTWHALNGLLTHPTLQEYARSLGINSYNAEANTIASDDIALLLAKLASGKLLNNANTKLLLGYLQRANMRAYIVAGVPDGVSVYHKTGYLSDRFHDGAIIQKGDRAFVLVIFSKTAGSYDFPKGADVFKSLTREASAVFFGK